MAEQIEAAAGMQGARSVGRVRYDKSVTAAQIQNKSIVELDGTPAGSDVRTVWEAVCG